MDQNKSTDHQLSTWISKPALHENDDGEPETIKDTCRDFMENTNTHGFGSILRAGHIVRRATWITIVLAGWGTYYESHHNFIFFVVSWLR